MAVLCGEGKALSSPTVRSQSSVSLRWVFPFPQPGSGKIVSLGRSCEEQKALAVFPISYFPLLLEALGHLSPIYTMIGPLEVKLMIM